MTTPMTIAPAPLPSPARSMLVEVLRDAHEREPFGPQDVRAVARRVADLAEGLGLPARIHRGGVDLGGAELDHVFVVVCERVVDLALPVRDERFVMAVRAWIAGDLEREDLTGHAARLGLEHRVVGEYPDAIRYRGVPVWGSAAA